MKNKCVQVYIAIVFLFLFCDIVLAYDDENTHPVLTTEAISRSSIDLYLYNNLKFASGSLSTVDRYPIIKILRNGSIEEDSPDCRAASHFLNPLKNWSIAGVSDTTETISGYIPDAWCFATDLFSSRYSTHKYSDVTWATGYTSPPTVSSQPIITGNGMDWNAARSYYYLALTATSNDAREEYFAQTFQTLGQVLHLLQDMAVPAHVRNDFTA